MCRRAAVNASTYGAIRSRVYVQPAIHPQTLRTGSEELEGSAALRLLKVLIHTSLGTQYHLRKGYQKYEYIK